MSSLKLPVIGLLAGLLLVGLWGAVVASAAPPSCLVSNDRTGIGYRSLQPAVDAAAAGDTLVVKGTCYGSTTIDKSLTLRGVSNNPFGIATLDGNGSDNPVLRTPFFGALPSVVIEYLRVTNGGGCGIAAPSVALMLSHATIADNGGCGISGFYTSVSLSDSIISDNAGTGIEGQNTSVTLTRSIVEDNGAGLGGMLTVTAADSTVRDNSGAGIWTSSSGPTSISGSTISGNHGPGVSVFDGSLHISGSLVGNNSGGGVNSGFATVGDISDSTIAGNSTSGNGGGLYISYCGSVHCLSLVRVTLSGNTAVGNGGGIYGAAGFFLQDSTVSDNTATSGGGIYFAPVFSGDLATLVGTNTFLDNAPDDCVGVTGC
jgi:predicted outer membrane repeat protein